MPNLIVRNFRRCERADLGGDLILVGGKNGNGKSSILAGVGLCATGEPVPAEMTRGETKRLVRDGAEGGSVVIDYGPEGVLRAVYPEARVNVDGKPTLLSRVAAGFTSICDMKPAEVSSALGPLIGAAPTKADVTQALKDLEGIDVAAVDKVWKSIEDNGWEKSQKNSQETGTKLKGLWENTTGEKWGASKADGWVPEGAEALVELNPFDTQAAVNLAEKKLADAEAGAAVDAKELARLRADADKLPSAQTALEQAEARVARIEREYADATAEREKLPFGQGNVPELGCPHCGCMVQIRSTEGVTVLAKSETEKISDEDRRQIRLKIADLDGVIAKLRAETKSAPKSVGEATAAVKAAERAVAELEAISQKGEGGGDVVGARADLEAAKERHAKVDRIVTAAKYQRSIKTNLQITGLLGPGGIRSTVLKKRLEDFNENRLAPIAKAGGFKPVLVHPDLTTSFNGKHYNDLGESHQWIVRLVLQVALAQMDGSPFIIVDRADVLDADNRNRMFTMMQALKIRALIGMTMNKASLMPNLAGMKLGESYWISNGNTVPRAEAVEAEKASAAKKAA